MSVMSGVLPEIRVDAPFQPTGSPLQYNCSAEHPDERQGTRGQIPRACHGGKGNATEQPGQRSAVKNEAHEDQRSAWQTQAHRLRVAGVNRRLSGRRHAALATATAGLAWRRHQGATAFGIAHIQRVDLDSVRTHRRKKSRDVE